MLLISTASSINYKSLEIAIYNHELDSIKSIVVNKSYDYELKFWSWGAEQFIIYANSSFNDKPRYFIRYKENGDFLREEGRYTVPSSHIVKNPINDYDYLEVLNDLVYRSSLKHSAIQWSVNYSSYIKNKPEGETNPVKIKLKNYVVENKVVTVKLDVIYYNGLKDVVELKINLDTGMVY